MRKNERESMQVKASFGLQAWNPEEEKPVREHDWVERENPWK
jgi:hypothetical protein